jgi:ATP-dependent DNA helicase Q4
MTKLIELSDDESSTESSSDGGDSDDCELEICHEVNEPMRPKRSTTQSASTLHDSLENYFGYTEFRDGQEWAIRRVLAHERTLLVAPTGQGKSLCYALPAALMDGICLVVSPLISLMQDQLRQLPPKIPAATLSGSMTIAKMALIVDDVMRGRYKVLFVSPERLASAAFRRLVRPKFNVETREYERQFPTVSLLCVDEVS